MMNKELEALKLNDELVCNLAEIYSKYNGKQLGEILGMQDIQSIIDKVKQALTPPTADEVIKDAELIVKLQAKLDKIEEVINKRLFEDYISDVEIVIIQQILKEDNNEK